MKTWPTRSAAFGWLMLGVVFLCPEPARALLGDSAREWGIDGSLRTLSAATVNYRYPLLFGPDNLADGLSQSQLRLIFKGTPVEWLSFEVHGVQSLTLSTQPGTGVQAGAGFLSIGPRATRYRPWEGAWDWSEEGDVAARLWLDRCSLKLALPWADVIIGRQAITFGKAYFWNPLDDFLAFDPRQFDRDYKGGVDALRIDVPLGEAAGVNLVGVLGRRLDADGTTRDGGALWADWYGSALLGRVFANLLDWDLAIQGGKVYGGFELGAGASGEIGPVAVRAEAAYLFAQESDRLPYPLTGREIASHLTAVLGVGHRFESTLDLEAEYLFNGAGDPDHLEAAALRVMAGDSFHMGTHLLGLVASYELLPILRGQLAWIFSISDQSTLLQPGLNLSVSDESDFVFGAMIALGKRPKDNGLNSEFGTYPNVYYLEYKYYF